MRNRIVKTAWLLAFIPSLGLAQQERGKGSWEWSAGGGVKFMDGRVQEFLASGPVANRFTSNTNPRRAVPGGALRLGYSFSDHFGFSVAGEVGNGDGITYLTPIVALTYTPRLSAKLSPFLTLGSQVTRVVGQNERRTHPTWGMHVGAGIRQMFSDNWAMRLDGRVASEHYAELPGRKAAYPAIATLGMSYFTGGKRAPTMVAVASEPIVRWRTDTVQRWRVDTVRVTMKEYEPSPDQLILRVQFRTDAAELLPISRPVLDTIAMAIIETPGSHWEVQGHTDNVGKPADNRALAQARAQTVVDYLVSKGVNRVGLSAVGFGEDRPVFSNSTLYGRAQNRRVQLRRVPPPPKGQAVP